MNVLFFGHTLRSNAGGIERYTSTILKELKKRGYTIYVYVLNEGDEDPDYYYINKHVKKRRFTDKFLFGYRINQYLKKEHITINIFFCGHLYLVHFCELISKRIRVKYHLFVYGIDCWGVRFREASHKMKSMDKVISISSFTTEQVRKQGYSGEVVYFPPLVEVPEKIAVNNLLANEKVILLTVGRLDVSEQYKGQDSVIRAMQIVKEKFATIEYWIVGRGNDNERLKLLAKELKLEDSVKFLGFVDDKTLSEINQKADIFIMPSKVSLNPEKLEGEGFGIVFIEAALYQKALIGSNIGGSTDIIDNEVNGLTCDPQSIEDIARCILKLATDRQLRQKLGKNALAKVQSNFSLQQFDHYFKPLIP